MAIKKVIDLDRGATLKLTMKWWADTAKTIPLDLTGYTFSLEDHNFPVASTPVASILGVPGQTRILLPALQTDTLRKSPPGNPQYYFKFQLTDPAGDEVVSEQIWIQTK